MLTLKYYFKKTYLLMWLQHLCETVFLCGLCMTLNIEKIFYCWLLSVERLLKKSSTDPYSAVWRRLEGKQQYTCFVPLWHIIFKSDCQWKVLLHFERCTWSMIYNRKYCCKWSSLFRMDILVESCREYKGLVYYTMSELWNQNI